MSKDRQLVIRPAANRSTLKSSSDAFLNDSMLCMYSSVRPSASMMQIVMMNFSLFDELRER